MEKGMLVWVYRSGDDCTNNGDSSKFDRLVLIGEGIPPIFEPREDMPALRLKERFGYKYATPDRDTDAGHVGWMMGGNFIYSSDSRFREICEYPIPVHDRQEGQSRQHGGD